MSDESRATENWNPLFTDSEALEGRTALDPWCPEPDGVDLSKVRQAMYEVAGRMLHPEDFPWAASPSDPDLGQRAVDLEMAMLLWSGFHDEDVDVSADIAGFTLLLFEEEQGGESDQDSEGGGGGGEPEEREPQESKDEGEEREGDREGSSEEVSAGEPSNERKKEETPSIGVLESERDDRTELLAKLLPSLRHGVGDPTTNVEPAKLDELAKRFENDPYWRKLLDLVGRLSQSAWSPPSRVPSTAREDVLDLELGADPSRILVTELARFAIDGLAPLAWLDFAERRMTQIQVEGTEPRSNGPILVAVDTSYSMEDPSGLGMSRCELAVILLLSIVRIGDIQKRKIFSCGFSSSVNWAKRAHTTAESVDLCLFLLDGPPSGGGTDFDPPLRLLCGKAKKSESVGSDILMVTDGEAPVSGEVQGEISRLRKKNGTRLFSLIIGTSDHSVLDDISDLVVRLRSWEDLEQITKQISRRPKRPGLSPAVTSG